MAAWCACSRSKRSAGLLDVVPLIRHDLAECLALGRCRLRRVAASVSGFWREGVRLNGPQGRCTATCPGGFTRCMERRFSGQEMVIDLDHHRVRRPIVAVRPS